MTKLISVRIEHEELARANAQPPQHGLWDGEAGFVEEDVEKEAGRELPVGVDDPAKVKEEDLRPVRSAKNSG